MLLWRKVLPANQFDALLVVSILTASYILYVSRVLCSALQPKHGRKVRKVRRVSFLVSAVLFFPAFVQSTNA